LLPVTLRDKFPVARLLETKHIEWVVDYIYFSILESSCKELETQGGRPNRVRELFMMLFLQILEWTAAVPVLARTIVGFMVV